MRTFTFVVAIALAGCNSQMQQNAAGKSLFALAPADFAKHSSVSLNSTQSTSPCTMVTQGDVLFFTASGSMNTTLGPVGPNGKSWGGIIFTLLNRPAFGLFGALGDSRFAIGEQLSMIAPRSGCLSTLVNGCQSTTITGLDGGVTPGFDCTTTGAFTVDTFSQLNDGVTIATMPSVSDNTVSTTQTFTVDAAQGWQSTGLMLARGQKVFVSASGQFTSNGQTWGPDGDGSCIGGTAFPLDVRQCYRLFGQVGDTVIDLGKSGVFLSPGAGELQLSVNGWLGATSGSVSVNVGSGVVPARGLLEEDAQGFTQSATVTVNPDGLWLGTGVTVHKGDPMLVSASGQLSGPGYSSQPVGPNGVGSVGGYPYPVINRPILALYAQIGSEVVFLGDENVLLAPDDGPVQLLINQTNWCTTKVCTEVDGGFVGAQPPDCLTAEYCAAYGTATGSFTATVRAP